MTEPTMTREEALAYFSEYLDMGSSRARAAIAALSALVPVGEVESAGELAVKLCGYPNLIDRLVQRYQESDDDGLWPRVQHDGDSRTGPNGTRIQRFWGNAGELCRIPRCRRPFAEHAGESRECPIQADAYPTGFAERVNGLLAHPPDEKAPAVELSYNGGTPPASVVNVMLDAYSKVAKPQPKRFTAPDRTEEVIASRYAAGEAIDALATDYGLGFASIEKAIMRTLAYLLDQEAERNAKSERDDACAELRLVREVCAQEGIPQPAEEKHPTLDMVRELRSQLVDAGAARNRFRSKLSTARKALRDQARGLKRLSTENSQSRLAANARCGAYAKAYAEFERVKSERDTLSARVRELEAEPGPLNHPDGSVLHALWGLAHDNPGYDKEQWLRLQREFRSNEIERTKALRDKLDAANARAERMGAVVEAARAVFTRINAIGRVEYHGHFQRPGGCLSCIELNELRDALDAAEGDAT